MTYYLSWILARLNSLINAVSVPLLKWISHVPGWLSNTIISAIVGIVLLVIFKYVSNQKAIGKVKDSIKANMLAMRLFKESIVVTFKIEGQLLKGAASLLLYSVKPVLVMIFPVLLILAQLSVWYQQRPLNIGEEALVTVQMNNNMKDALSDVILQPETSVDTIMGPVVISSKNQVFWKLKAKEQGYHTITFDVDSKKFTKELAIGNGFMRTSPLRPGYHPLDIIEYPAESPLPPDSIVESISVEYPDRNEYLSGTDWWVIYFFGASMFFAMLFKPILKVRF
jgi:uncharacterized membrane protein (DUF106 family)